MRRISAALVLTMAAGAMLGGCERKSPSPTSPGATSATVVTLVDVTESIQVTSGGTGTFNWVGQSVSLPAGGPYANIRFNWYTFRKEAAAFGNLYVLTEEYLGLSGNLNASTPGFVARSERIESGEYVFAASVKLTGGRKYWFYTDAQGSFAGSFDTDIYPGGDMYLSGYHAVPFFKAPASGRMVNGVYVPPPTGVFLDANFRLQGSVAQ